jgi:prepilin-type N-terminal cleavage/methylation domain-containing protein
MLFVVLHSVWRIRMNRSYAIRQAGFTLVEITIVLIILGLLLGTLLWGQELVLSGRSKSVIVNLNELAAAVAIYRDRYAAVPGDDPGAQVRWNWTAVPAATPSTPGDQSVDGAYNLLSAVPEPESRLFWWHLRQAGFVKGAADAANAALAAQQPINIFGGMTGVTMGIGPATVGLIGLIACTANVPGKVAIGVDARLDDGGSAGGDVRGQRQLALNDNLGPAASGYVEDGGLYLVCRKL